MDEGTCQIVVKPSTWKKIFQLKNETKEKSVDAVIGNLLARNFIETETMRKDLHELIKSMKENTIKKRKYLTPERIWILLGQTGLHRKFIFVKVGIFIPCRGILGIIDEKLEENALILTIKNEKGKREKVIIPKDRSIKYDDCTIITMNHMFEEKYIPIWRTTWDKLSDVFESENKR